MSNKLALKGNIGLRKKNKYGFLLVAITSSIAYTSKKLHCWSLSSHPPYFALLLSHVA